MSVKFTPHYTITSKVANSLMRIEAVKERVLHLPLMPTVLASLRETARLVTTHYSTRIEGNRLVLDQIEEVIKHEGHFPGRERDEKEVKGYYAALTQVEQWVAQATPIHEKMIQIIHSLVMANGRPSKVKPTPYRDGQNVIRDGHTRAIIYMPPEASDVPGLMHAMVEWIHVFWRKSKWQITSVQRILQNSIYHGDFVLNRHAKSRSEAEKNNGVSERNCRFKQKMAIHPYMYERLGSREQYRSPVVPFAGA
jgi:hypothetical protein